MGHEEYRANPFRPGTGGLPPYLAGRRGETTFFRRMLHDLADGLPPSREVILYGPRGNGKTALLVWLRDEVLETPGVDVVRVTPSELGTIPELVYEISAGPANRHLLRQASRLVTQISLYGVTLRREQPTARVKEALLHGTRRRGLVLLVDEAHTLKAKIGNALLNASQQVGRDRPFLLVLAGTPNLRDRLAQMQASFWNRAHRIQVNRLNAASSEAAIRIPLERDGFTIERPGLDRIVDESHGYPYFLQLWGSFLWRFAQDKKRRQIRSADVAAVHPPFTKERDFYYQDRYLELANRDLLFVARRVADAFRTSASLHHLALTRLVERACDTTKPEIAPSDALMSLKHFGFVWQPGAEPEWEPGIPSLMDYVLKHVPASVSAP